MRILFQGDSITDAGRARDNDINVGVGYPLLVKATLSYENHGKYEFFNRGIGGNRIVDLYARLRSDIINLKPDVMSMLVGVNDVWHEYSHNNGIDPDKFYKIYDMLIQEVKTALPDLKIIIMEPFVLKGTATAEKWDKFEPEVKKRGEMARKIAEKYNLPYVELQKGFDELSKNTGTDYWLADGVHPTAAGHEYLKTEWLKAFNDLGL